MQGASQQSSPDCFELFMRRVYIKNFSAAFTCEKQGSSGRLREADPGARPPGTTQGRHLHTERADSPSHASGETPVLGQLRDLTGEGQNGSHRRPTLMRDGADVGCLLG